MPYDKPFGEYQGGTFNGVRERLRYIKDLGAGAIWLSPVLKNRQSDRNSFHVERVDTSDRPDLVAIQVYITSARRAYALADHYRAQGIFVALGGLHVTSLPDEAAAHADAIFLGPGEQIFPQFLEDFRAGRPRSRYVSASGRTLERLPPIRRDLIRRRSYLVPNSIVVTRGCPQHCDFCYKDAFFEGGRSFYTQRVDDALAEIDRLPGRHLYFLDDHLFGDRRFASALFEGMEMGGANSHGAVVAREYGIPAVVGVSGATARIVTGQKITVDGSAGTVNIG